MSPRAGIILAIALCGAPCVRAQGWQVSPARYEVRAVPGESHTFAITLERDGIAGPDLTPVRFTASPGDWDIDREFLAVAADAARFHHGATLAWDGGDTEALAGALRAVAPLPTAVLFFVRPERFDGMLHRRILLALCTLDEDPFVDATFGYLTARDEKVLRHLWQRTEAMHRDISASSRSRWPGRYSSTRQKSSA